MTDLSPSRAVFTIALGLLLLASLGTYLTQPTYGTERVVMYWVTDLNPERRMQVRLFEQWLVENGHTTGSGEPIIDLRLDAASRTSNNKKVIQAISGVGGDIIDLSAGKEIRYFQTLGALRDVTEDAERLGFEPSTVWEPIRSELLVDGRQYAYSCNAGTTLLWVNLETIRRHGLEPPPQRWTFEAFEDYGKRFVEAANPGPGPQRVFLIDYIDTTDMHRSLGLSRFNETLTACVLDDPRYTRVIELYKKWTYEDGLIPTSAEKKGFNSTAGFVGQAPQLFNSGNYAMVCGGRFMLIQLRRFGMLDLRVAEPPHGVQPITTASTRAAGVYVNGRDPELATLFLSFLASDLYNDRIVEMADNLPSCPDRASTDAFLNPPAWPNERRVHEPFARAMREIAVPLEMSPFVLSAMFKRVEQYHLDSFMNDKMTAEEAAAGIVSIINTEIERRARSDPRLAAEYERLLAVQEEIDRLKAEGEPVPLAMIENPFLRRLAEREAGSPGRLSSASMGKD